MKEQKEYKKEKKNKKIKVKKNIYQITSKVCIILSIFLILGWVGLYALNYKVDYYSAVLTPTEDEVEIVKKSEISALVCGINGYLTDTIIYVRANLETGKIAYMSIPRDTYVNNPYCIGHKINAIYRKIDINPLISQVEKMLDVNIDYYLLVDNEIVKNAVDAIGGVEFNVPIDMKYDDGSQNLHIDLKAGLQILDGNKAEQVIRFRKNNNGTGYRLGDIDRVKVQQDFIKAFIKQAAKPENILNADKIIKTVLLDADTNVTVREAISYVTDVPKMNLDNIYTTTAIGTTPYINNISYFKMNEKETRKIIQEKFFDELDKK